MNSMPNADTGTPDAALAARADERLAHAYEQITRADEQLARVTEQLSRLEKDGTPRSSVAPGLRPSRRTPLLRGLTGLVLAAGICAAAFAAKSPHGETARLIIAQWAPGFFAASLAQLGTPGVSAQPIPTSVQLASAEATPSPAARPLQPAQELAPTPAPLPPELTQLLETMAHDIAVVEQGIEQLKASQERMFADNAKAIEQVKASQEQLTKLAARPAENRPSDPRAKTAAAPRPPTMPNATREAPPARTPQARARPQPIQLQPDAQ